MNAKKSRLELIAAAAGKKPKQSDDYYENGRFDSSVKSKGKGYGARYDKGTPAWIDIERHKSNGTGMAIECRKRRCTACKEKKPVKGGTNKQHRFVCADCNELAGGK